MRHRPAMFVGTHRQSFLVTSALFVALCVLFPSVAPAQNPNPRVLPPNSAPLGRTYGEWSALWVQWAWGTTTADNPVLDTTWRQLRRGSIGARLVPGRDRGAGSGSAQLQRARWKGVVLSCREWLLRR